MAIQYEVARRLLPIIVAAAKSHQLINYQTAAEALGRPKDNARMVAQVCDLIDAAAALAGTPLLALWIVRESSGHVNRNAWAKGPSSALREAIIELSQKHTFTQADFDAIGKSLGQLKDRSNRAAWTYIRETLPNRMRTILEGYAEQSIDAIDDLGTERPTKVAYTGVRYARDPKIRAAVMKRAGGKCEYCGEPGFICKDGTRYLEAHHILALADEGSDLMTNVIAICPGEHREVHYGERRAEMEVEMIKKVNAAEALRLSHFRRSKPCG